MHICRQITNLQHSSRTIPIGPCVCLQCPLTSGGVLTASEHPPGKSVEIFRAINIIGADESRMSRMPQGDLRITYGSVADINYTWHPPTFYGKFKQFVFSVAFPWTLHIHCRCHKDITDSTDVFMHGKYHPHFSIIGILRSSGTFGHV